MKIMHCFLISAIASVAIPLTANAGTITFDSFTTGTSVNGQGGWTVEDSFGNASELFDESVVDDGTGNKVWRMSNAAASTSYSNQPFSHKADAVAGETGAGLYNDYGSDHTNPNDPVLSSATAGSKNFYASWDFKSATNAEQDDLFLAISAGASQSTLRQTYIGIDGSDASGFELNFYDTTGSSFVQTTLATGLSYSDWHTVEMYIDFVDGIGPGNTGNDIVNILVDGALVHTGTTWESYYDSLTGNPGPRAVDSLLFRASSAAPGTSGNGIYFDNITVSNAQLNTVPEPSSLLIFGVAAGTFIAGRRRRGRKPKAVHGVQA